MTTTALQNAPTPRPRRSLRIVLLAAGSVVLVALIVSAILIVGNAVGGKRSNASAKYSITESFDAIRINAKAADITVQYANVAFAQVIFHQGTEIRSATVHHAVASGVLIVTESVSGSVPFGSMAADPTTLEIVLPQSHETTPTEVGTTVQAGNVDLNGRFAAVTIASNAGNVTLHGGARSLNVKVQSGNVTATSYVLQGSITSATTAGNSTYDFRTLPSRATLNTSAGNLSLIVPKGNYQVHTRSGAGTVHQGVTNTLGASRIYKLQATAGNITVANP